MQIPKGERGEWLPTFEKVLKLSGLGAIGVGLSLFCNPQDLLKRLIPGARRVLESMGDDAEVHVMIAALPEELVPDLAKKVNDVMRRRVDATGRPLTKSDQSLKKVGTKPHHPLEAAVKKVYESFQYGGNPKEES